MKKWGQIALCLYFLRGMNVRKREISLEKGGEKGQGTAGGRALARQKGRYQEDLISTLGVVVKPLAVMVTLRVKGDVSFVEITMVCSAESSFQGTLGRKI